MVQFHLLKQHNIVFNNDNDLDEGVYRAQHSIIMLMVWFQVNQVDLEATSNTYAEFSKYYV